MSGCRRQRSPIFSFKSSCSASTRVSRLARCATRITGKFVALRSPALRLPARDMRGTADPVRQTRRIANVAGACPKRPRAPAPAYLRLGARVGWKPDREASGKSGIGRAAQTR